VAAVLALSLIGGLAGSNTVRAATPKSQPTRPEASTAGNGPVVANADPFTTDGPGLAPGQIEMTTVSSRPALVTGDEARLAVRGLQSDDRLSVTSNGADVTKAFTPTSGRPGQAPGAAEGLVSGLVVGENHLRATAVGKRYGTRTVTLTVIDHSLQGPVISGPHQQPFVCQTQQSGLGPPQGPDCLAPTQIHWWYKNLLGQFQQLTNPYAPYPADTSTTSVNGRSVPFVIRIESKVINRGIARIGVLDDPHGRGPTGPFTPVDWNHRLLYHFGESCGTGYHQGSNQESEIFGSLASFSGSNLVGPLLDLTSRLGSGYMVAESTLTIFGVHCNQVLSAETLMMVKEHIINDYGDITHTISGGASGGAIQQYTSADGFPGLLDAGTPLLSFPDVISTAMTVYDCVVLLPAFKNQAMRWNVLKQQAVTGLADFQVCQDWHDLFGGNLDPTNCPGGIPKSQVYNPTTNPHGVRCDLQDDIKNIVGVDPTTGYAYRPIDDVGVQYGLKALQAGLITPDDFVALNSSVGGVDLAGQKTTQRVSMAPALAHRMYEVGAVGERGAINLTPMIDQTIPLSDIVPVLDIHDQIRPFEVRARLDARYGNHASHAIWSLLPAPSSALVTADQWLDRLDALQAANPSLTRAELVAQSQPPGAGDQCRLAIVGIPIACDQGVLRHSSPRQEAGGPLSEDNIKCQLRPVTASDYPGTLSAAQLSQIQQVFPSGVCDYSKPAVGWTKTSATWNSYGDSTLYDPPVQVPYTLVRSG
jgi:hypothetical protein